MLDFIDIFAKAIKKRRKGLGLIQERAAERAGVASRTILDIENHNDDPRLSTVGKIIRGLQMDANDIFYPEIKCGTPNQVRLQTVFADCSDAEAEMLFEVCAAVLSSLRKMECTYVEKRDEKEPASPLV